MLDFSKLWMTPGLVVKPGFQEFSEYMLDLIQRNILFMDVMRRRGNEMLDMTHKTSATVLHFDYKIIMDGKDFKQPINYWLAKIIPPAGLTSDDSKRPYVIQDPRAGQGPGIGGFKKDSEIGDALSHGHPVYFIGFNSEPFPNQTYEDIIRGQLNFYEYVAELHSANPPMCIIGNCAAGYLSMFSAMQRPELFGPILIAGSPLSYWNGVRGRNPMRYQAGLVGGVWINSFLGDLGAGKFDGSYLILNFDLLNLANFLWDKQYSLYANIDKGSNRYLEFEKWWGDFIQFNTEEIKWLVDKLFIGNELTTGKLTTNDGILLDPRVITSPIITFVSDGDNISPPSQSAGWIADLYHDEKEIAAKGKTIIYCLNHKVGHLAIFTATKVGRREDEMFVDNMDTIDMLPPGLYELVLDTPEGEELNQKLESRYIPRTIEDIKNLGYNSEEDDRAFATVAKASKAIDFVYGSFIHPWFKLFEHQGLANVLKDFKALRLSYMLFSDKVNPAMQIFEVLANRCQAERIQLSENNPFWALQDNYANFISNCLTGYQEIRDSLREQFFFSVWGNPLVQDFWGTATKLPRSIPALHQHDKAIVEKQLSEAIANSLPIANNLEALMRIAGLVTSQGKSLSEQSSRILLSTARKLYPNVTDQILKTVIRQQALVVSNQRELAIKELKDYSISHKDFSEVINAIKLIISQMGKLRPEIEKAVEELRSELGLNER